MSTDLPFDLFILLLRIAFIFLLYFFLFQVMRVVSRELRMPPPRPVAAESPSLTLVDAGQSELAVGAVHLVQPVTTIGRTDDNVIVLPDSFVSSHHARLVQTGGRWYLTDLGSTNGTFVEGRRVGQRPELLKDGDTVQIGRLKLRLALP